MGCIRFDFGSSYNENTLDTANKLTEKLNDLLGRFNIGEYGFFNEILPNTIGFYVSSPNMNREPEKRPGKTYANIPNFFFRLDLDEYAKSQLQGNTVILKGNLSIKDDTRNNCVYVHDIYLTRQTDKHDYEKYYPGSADYQNKEKPQFNYYNEEITLGFAREIPSIVNNANFDQFTRDWHTYLNFEKAVTIGNIKSYPISGDIRYDPVCEVVDNAVNREKFEGDIIGSKNNEKLFVDRNSPKLNGDEQPLVLLSITIDGKRFGNTKDERKKSAVNFARLGLSVIGQKQETLLNELMNQLKMNDEEKRRNNNELREIEGVDMDDWLTPLYDDEKVNVIFKFLVDDESKYHEERDPKSEIKKFGDNLFLAHIASGDIALYKRGKDTLDRIKKGDVKNPYIAGYIIEPEKFENNSDLFNEQNIKFALKDLNNSQKEAIIKCLNSNSIFLLQGPPGTGKTQTITELVYQFNKMGKKVLLSSQTHIAIDNVIERLPKELNILPIRLVRDRSKANEKYLPDRLLDNLYDAAYDNYRGKIETFESYEKNISDTTDLFEKNKSRYENVKARLSKVKELEEIRNNLTKELSNLHSLENAKDSELKGIERSLETFKDYYITKMPFEKVLDRHMYVPFLDELHKLAEKYEFDKQDDIYNYAILLKRRAGIERIAHLNVLSKGGDKPAEIIAAENAVAKVQKIIDEVKKRGYEINETLKKEMNEALQRKKLADRKYESSGGKILSIDDVKPFFVKGSGDVKSVITEELKAINDFKMEYETVLKDVFNNKEFNSLKDEKDALETEITKNETNIRRISVDIKKIENDIAQQNKPIESERKKLEEYFVSFYTDKLNGAALPETEKDKFDGIKVFIEEEKKKLDAYRNDYEKLKDIYSSLVGYLENRQDFVKSQRGKYTKNLLKHNANVYGITCTSSPYFRSDILVGGRGKDGEDETNIEVEPVNIRDIDFDVVIIDEVSKATPIEMLIPIIYGKSVVLVGDQRQLPPIFKYRENIFYGKTPEERNTMLQGKELKDFKNMVETSLFEKIFNKLDKNRAMLTEQYRFNEPIMNCVNVFYDGKLSLGLGKEQNNKKQNYLDVSIENVKEGRRPTQIFCRKNSTYWFNSHLWTDGTVAYSEVREGETSYRNPLEVKITVELLLLLERGYGELKEKNPEEYQLSAGDGKKPSVAVISMYGKHIASIRNELNSRKIQKNSFKNISLDISTVDNYQGKEQDIVLVNMVANTKDERPSEFLQKFNRINVAISRARTMLIMVGSRRFYDRVSINVPKMDTGEKNSVNAYYHIYDKCQLKWEASANLFRINKEGVKA
jgi:superfamily I DNA and/or RNA helicase